MDMHIFLIIVLIVIVIIIGLKWMKRPLRHRIYSLDELGRYLKGLINQCTIGSILIVEDKKTKRFVQFVKIGNSEKVNLHFGFPDAPWSRNYFKKVAEALKNQKIQYTIKPTGEDVITNFLEIDNIFDIDSGVEIAKVAFQAMDIQPSGHFQVYYEGGLSEEVLKKKQK